MRRLLACAALATAALAAPASAWEYDYCTIDPVTHTPIGACVHAECVDICGPEVKYDVYCDLDDHPKIRACTIVDGL